MLDRLAHLLGVVVAGIGTASLITVATWPAYQDGTWNLQHPPAWWQLDILASVGVLLLAAPSYVIYLLDGYFSPGSTARAVVANTLATLEIALLMLAAHRLSRLVLDRLRSDSGTP